MGFGLGLGVRSAPPLPGPPLGGPMWGGAGLAIGGVGVGVGGGIVGTGAPDPVQWHPAAANHFFAAAQSPFVHGSPTSPHNGA